MPHKFTYARMPILAEYKAFTVTAALVGTNGVHTELITIVWSFDIHLHLLQVMHMYTPRMVGKMHSWWYIHQYPAPTHHTQPCTEALPNFS